jgi:CRISPR-associated protein Cas5 subtype I-A
MVFLSVKVFVPVFSVRHHDSRGVRVSTLLPPPRTVLGALARGLGVLLGLESGEQRIAGRLARDVLTEAVECSSYAFVRPTSPLVRASHVARIVRGVEEGLKREELESDAFKHDAVFSGELRIIYALSLTELNRRLSEHRLGDVTASDVVRASRMIDHIGPTEAFCHVVDVKLVGPPRKVEPPTPINTYAPIEHPAKWAELSQNETQSYLIERLYPNLRVLGLKAIPLDPKEKKEYKQRRLNYLLPVALVGRRRGREVFEGGEVVVVPTRGHSIYSLEDEEPPTKILLPEGELKDELV